MPTIHRYVQPLAKTIEAIELIVDERFQWTDVERTNAASRLRGNLGANRKKCGLGFSSSCRRRDDYVSPPIQNRAYGSLLDLPQLRPALIPNPPLHLVVKALES